MINKILCFKKIYKKKKYVIVVKFISSKNKIVEKIGTYDIIHKKLTINIYRLIFFISKGVKMVGSLFLILKRFRVINRSNFKNDRRYTTKRYVYKKKRSVNK
jgi:hypothetical protein